MKNINGTLYVFSGNANGGCRISTFTGSYSWSEIGFFEDVFPPLQGAVDGLMKKMVMGSAGSYIEDNASVFSCFSKNGKIPMGLHNILRSMSSGSNKMVTALKYIGQENFSKQQPIVGWSDDTASGLDRLSTTNYGANGGNVIRTEVFKIGQPFEIVDFIVPLLQPIDTGTNIEVKVYIDNGNQIISMPTINTTNFPPDPSGVKKISGIFKCDGQYSCRGEHSFFIELRFKSTILNSVMLPITFKARTIKY